VCLNSSIVLPDPNKTYGYFHRRVTVKGKYWNFRPYFVIDRISIKLQSVSMTLMLYMDHIFVFHQVQSCEGHKFWPCSSYCFCFIMKVFLFVCSFYGVCKMNVYRWDQPFLFLCPHDSAWEPQDRVWSKLYVIHSICVLINILSNKCTSWYNTHNIYKLLHVLAPKCHPQGVTATCTLTRTKIHWPEIF
jgi:hypothetical protein